MTLLIFEVNYFFFSLELTALLHYCSNSFFFFLSQDINLENLLSMRNRCSCCSGHPPSKKGSQTVCWHLSYGLSLSFCSWACCQKFNLHRQYFVGGDFTGNWELRAGEISCVSYLWWLGKHYLVHTIKVTTDVLILW